MYHDDIMLEWLYTITRSNNEKTTSATKETTSKKSSLDVFKENDYYSDYQTEETTTIALSSQTTDVKITSAGCYVLEGSLQKHSIIVDAKENDVVRIVLQNASIQSASTAPIYIKRQRRSYYPYHKELKIV